MARAQTSVPPQTGLAEAAPCAEVFADAGDVPLGDLRAIGKILDTARRRRVGTLLHRRPDAMHIVVIVQVIEKLADFRLLLFGQAREVLRHVADLAGDDGPAVFGEPLRDGVQLGALGDEARADAVPRGCRRSPRG